MVGHCATLKRDGGGLWGGGGGGREGGWGGGGGGEGWEDSPIFLPEAKSNGDSQPDFKPSFLFTKASHRKIHNATHKITFGCKIMLRGFHADFRS